MKKRDRKKRLRKRLERISQAGKGKPEPLPPSTDPSSSQFTAPAELRFEVICPSAGDIIDCELVNLLSDPEP